MGSVYAAYDPDLDRKVALKLVRPDRASEEEQARLLREARALARLAHPNVVRVYDVGLHGDQVFFAMEFVSGRNLRQWLTARRPGWRRVVRLFREVARGLAAAHEQGLVHRDLKPANILIGDDGVARIADFGLVSGLGQPAGNGALPSPADSPVAAARAETSGRMGTPGYMAPELVLGEPADELSDQYSFSVALHFALFGERPAAGDGPHASPQRRGSRKAGPREPGPRRGVPAKLRKILKRGLNSDPAGRHPSMSVLDQELTRLLRRGRQRWATAGVLGALVLAVPLWLTYLDRRGPPPCSWGEERLAGVWDPARRQALEQAFLATGSDFAGEALGDVARVLDRYRSDWLGMHRQVCLATRVRGEQSEQLLDLQMLCLERRREELRGVTDLLLAGGTEILPKAVQTTEALSSVTGCDDRAELAILSPLPREPALRDEIEELQALVARESVRRRTGHKSDLPVLERAILDADRVGYPPLAAAARAELGLAQLKQAAGAEVARETLEAALRSAIAGRDRTLAARLYGRLAEVTGYNQGDHQRGLWWSRLAEAALAALGPGQEEAMSQMRASLGLVAWSAGRFDDAELHWQRGLELARKLRRPGDSGTAELLNNLGLIPSKSSRERLGYLEAALELKQEAYGAWNPLLANTLVNLGGQMAAAGRYAEGLAFTGRAADILESFHGEHRDLAFPWVLEAEILNRLDRPQEAEALLARAGAVLHDLDERHFLRVQLLLDLAESMLLQLRLAEAEATFERAAAIEEGYPEESFLRFAVQLTRGRLALLRDRPGSARRALEGAVSAAEGRGSEMALWETVCLPAALGEAYLELGRPDLARPHLEAAVGRAGRTGSEPVLGAAARFALARLLAAEDPERAESLARRAAADLTGAGSAWSRGLGDAVEAWLDR